MVRKEFAMTRRALYVLVASLTLLFTTALAGRAAPVGSAVVTVTPMNAGVTKYSVAWTSDASGDVSGNAFGVSQGYIISLKFIPGTGSTVPTAAYDVTLLDRNSANLIGTSGANLSETASTVVTVNPAAFQDGTQPLDLVVANAGNAKTGTVVIWIANR
jgi:hypothetical protein